MSEERIGRKMLTDDMLKAISEEAARVAVEKYQEAHKKSVEFFRDKRFTNTKLLLRNYRALKYFNEHTIYDVAELTETGDNEILLEAIGMQDEGRVVANIRNRVAFTRVAMENIESALVFYKAFCEKSPKPEVQRRWRVLYKLYLGEEEMFPNDVANSEHISLSQVYEDINNAAHDLEQRFFGIDVYFFE